MNNRYALQGILCIVIHAVVVEGVVPVEQFDHGDKIVGKADKQEGKNIVPEKLTGKRNGEFNHDIKNPRVENFPLENNVDNVKTGAKVHKKNNLLDSYRKIPKSKSVKQKLHQDPLPAGDITSFKKSIPAKNDDSKQDLLSLQKLNSDLKGHPAVLPAANINFTHDGSKKAKDKKKYLSKSDTKLDAQSGTKLNVHANNVQQQADLRKQERDNARRNQENQRQEQEKYQRHQEYQLQRHAEETRKKNLQQSANQNVKNDGNENVKYFDNLQDRKRDEKLHNLDDGAEQDQRNVEQNQHDQKPQQGQSEFNEKDIHQQEGIADDQKKHPKQESNRNVEQMQNEQQQKHPSEVNGEDMHQKEDIANVHENHRNRGDVEQIQHEQRTHQQPEVNGQDIHQHEDIADDHANHQEQDLKRNGDQSRGKDNEENQDDSDEGELSRKKPHDADEERKEDLDQENKDEPTWQDQKINFHQDDAPQQEEHRTVEAVGQADVKWDGDDFALMFGDSVYMEQKIRRASVPTAGEPWPKPQYIKVRKTHVFYIAETFKFNINEKTCDIIELAAKRYENIILKYSLPDMHDNLEFADGSDFEPENLKYEKPPYTNASALVSMNVRIRTRCVEYPSSSMDESYTLVVKSSRMYIAANEVWGALRALETFSQMVVKGTDSRLYIKEVLVNDYARFQHRGVLIDTSRHFIFKEVLYDALEAMSQNKLNVMHWHIVDDQSFPYMSKAFPDLSKKGAFQSEMVYTPRDIADVIEYARLRGIRVVPEFDTPGHTYSWGLGYPDLLTQCHSGPSPVKGYLGPLNPASNYTYDFLQTFFEEVLTVFKDNYIHLGGDEVPLSCWVSNPEILKFSESIGAYGDTRKLMEYYETRLLKILDELALKKNTGIETVIWQDVIDNVDQLPERVVIGVWRGGMPDVQRATSMGHKVIYSTCWYLDLIEYGSKWYKYYLCDPTDSSSGYIDERLVIGGEAALWAEYIDNENLMTTLWPRASATAERLWSHKDTRDVMEAGRRMIEHRCRMLGRGLGVSQISGPDYCPSRGPRKHISASRLMEQQEIFEKLNKTNHKKRIDASHIELERFDLRIGGIHPAARNGRECGDWATRASLIHGNGWILVVLTLVILAAVFFQIRNNSAGYSANRILKNKTILFSFLTLLVIYVTCYTTIWLQVLDVKRSKLKVENSPVGPNPGHPFTS